MRKMLFKALTIEALCFSNMLIYLKARNTRLFRVYISSRKNTIKVGILERLPRDVDWIQLAKFILDTSKLKFHSDKI
jgi:hypothetical protein